MQEIRIAHIKDHSEIIRFIGTYWKVGHVFTKDVKLFNWQHFNKEKQQINFVIAKNLQTNSIDALLGFISPSQYDSRLEVNDIWLAIWKNADEDLFPGLGFKLYQHLLRELKPQTIGILGISPQAYEIYQQLKFKTGSLQHLYIANKELKDYSIAKIVKKSQEERDETSAVSLKEWDGEYVPSQTFLPQKSKCFLVQRYLKHPTYTYQIIQIAEEQNPKAIFVYRKIQIKSKFCLRVVDCLGFESLSLSCKALFQNLLEEEQAEYIDLLCNHEVDAYFKEIGFSHKDLANEIIPNYFEPFEKRNVEILYAYKSRFPYSIFKGDSDQDRPSI